jgi:hypothetical protein
VGGLDQAPTFARLTSDECLACLALRMQRVVVLLQAFLRGLAGVDAHRLLALAIDGLPGAVLQAEEQRPRPARTGDRAGDFRERLIPPIAVDNRVVKDGDPVTDASHSRINTVPALGRRSGIDCGASFERLSAIRSRTRRVDGLRPAKAFS